MAVFTQNPTQNHNYAGETMSNLEWFLRNQDGIPFALRFQLKKAYNSANGIAESREAIAAFESKHLIDVDVLAKLEELIENEDAPLA